MGIGKELGLRNLVEDATPQLGGDLDVAGQSVVSTSNGDIVLMPHGTGDVGIGTSSPGALCHVQADSTGKSPHADTVMVVERDGHAQLEFITPNNKTPAIFFTDTDATSQGRIEYSHTADTLTLTTGAVSVLKMYTTALDVPLDSVPLRFGLAQDFHIEWDGSDAVHTISAGQFRFVGGNIELEDTVDANAGVVMKGATPFIHNYHGSGGAATPVGQNVFIGEDAGNFTTGNTATNTSHGSDNVGVGERSLEDVAKGYQSTAVGSQALANLTDAGECTAMGHRALSSTLTGGNATAIGSYALYLSTGIQSTVAGSQAGFSTTTGDGQTFVGYQAGYGNTTGDKLTAVGHLAGRYIANGSTANETSNYGVYLGADTRASADATYYEVALGYGAIGGGTGTIVLGGSSHTAVILPNDSQELQFGADQDYGIKWDASDAVHTISAGQFRFVGGNVELEDTVDANAGVVMKGATPFIHNYHGSGGAATPVGQNVFIGEDAGNFTTGNTATETYHASKNVGIGKSVHSVLANGFYNVGCGHSSQIALTSGSSNCAAGYQSQQSLTSGVGNVAYGALALRYATDGNFNYAGGYNSLGNIIGGHNNYGGGYQAGTFIAGGSIANQTSGYSVYLGSDTKASADGADREVVIGYNAVGGGADTIVLGGSTHDTVILPNDNQKLRCGSSNYLTLWGSGGSVNFVHSGDELRIQSNYGLVYDIDNNNSSTTQSHSFTKDNGALELFSIDEDGSVVLPEDSQELRLGALAGGDVRLKHDGSNFIADISTGDFVFSGGSVGIGANSPGALCHIQASSTGKSPHADTVMVVERDGHAQLEFITPNNKTPAIFFTDTDATSQGRIEYSHTADTLTLTTGAVSILKMYTTALDVPLDNVPVRFGASQDFQISWDGTNAALSVNSGDFVFNGAIAMLEKSADPSEPAEGECIMWMSDGTGKGVDGDVLIASKAAGVTKWATLFDHSAGAAW